MHIYSFQWKRKENKKQEKTKILEIHTHTHAHTIQMVPAKTTAECVVWIRTLHFFFLFAPKQTIRISGIFILFSLSKCSVYLFSSNLYFIDQIEWKMMLFFFFVSLINQNAINQFINEFLSKRSDGKKNQFTRGTKGIFVLWGI